MPNLAMASIDEAVLEEAGRSLLDAVMVGGSWGDALDSLMPHLGCFGGTLSLVMPPGAPGLPTRSVEDVFREIASGRTPPMTKLTRMMPGPADGFVCDQMDIYRRPRERDAFYADFIRPRGLTFQASAYLDRTDGRVVNIMLFKGRDTTGFDPDELRKFRTCLPYLRAAVMSTRVRLRAEADRRAAPFVGRGDPVVHLSSDGLVLDRSVDEVGSLAPDVVLIGRRLAVAHPIDQSRLGRAILSAAGDRKPSLVTVSCAERHELRLLVMPVLAQALDLFRTTAVLVVALDITRPPRFDPESLDLLARAAGLTRREQDVTRLIVCGNNPRQSADLLQMSYATARQHLKTVYAKLGVHGRAELVAMLTRLSTH